MLVAVAACADEYLSGTTWEEPKVVDPGPVGGPPSDAIVLFDGKDMSQWAQTEKWAVQDGCMVGLGGSWPHTKQGFGDCQLHVEWAAPEKIANSGQWRGNSGIVMMGHYEIQVLDSYNNPTYTDGTAASVYKQHPPLVNASRKPGEWQSYDIIWHAPKFDDQGKLLKPANVTVLHNGVLVQDHFELLGDTFFDKPPTYTAHPDKLPITLGYHDCPVRFRNIWIREIKELPSTPGKPSIKKG